MKDLERVLVRLAFGGFAVALLIVTVAHYFWIVALAVGFSVLWRIAFGSRL